MKLALGVGYFGAGLDQHGVLALTQEADRLGYHSVWVAEAYGSDAVTVLSWLAGQTK
ncbi:MAG: LLM class flavin-dependent oxidoreductase, partial [Actinomycetota bacterium]